jgi:hypothetical protein
MRDLPIVIVTISLIFLFQAALAAHDLRSYAPPMPHFYSDRVCKWHVNLAWEWDLLRPTANWSCQILYYDDL